MKILHEIENAIRQRGKKRSWTGQAARLLVVAMTLLPMCGCVTAMTRYNGEAWGEPYFATTAAAAGIVFAYDREPLMTIPFCIALPFEAVFDTLFLPIDLCVR